ncbi:hypothetical protein JAO29_10125 [Edaphobacter sp. HDX4]|uniref:hypothetical protein n=1 Tax=Edaphobacter sp. HDX4 TaxID=2794064 RepID=UPI002FE64B47
MPANGFALFPTVEFFSASVPVRNDEVRVADEDRVVRQVEQAGSLLYFNLELVASLEKISLDAASDRAEP